MVLQRRWILARGLEVFQNSTKLNVPMQHAKTAHRQLSRTSWNSSAKVSTNFHVQDEEDFNDRVLKSKIPVVVDFHAEWCGPCKSLGPKIEKEVDSHDGKVFLAKVDIDEMSEIAMNYEVRVVPTVVGIKSGKIVDKFEGNIGETDIKVFVEKLMSEEKQ